MHTALTPSHPAGHGSGAAITNTTTTAKITTTPTSFVVDQHPSDNAIETETHTETIGHQERQDDDIENECILDCQTDQPKQLVPLLQSLLHTNTFSSKRHGNSNSGSGGGSSSSHNFRNDTMTLFCAPSGLTIHTHPNPQFQSTLELPASIFSQYSVNASSSSSHDNDDNNNNNNNNNNEDETTDHSLCLSSQTLLECLQVLTLENPLQMHWKYQSPVFRMEAVLPKGGGIVSAAILGRVPPEDTTATGGAAELSAAFGAEGIAARLLCPSEDLKDRVELEYVGGATTISIRFSNGKGEGISGGLLTLSVDGHSSRCQVIIPGPVEITSPSTTTNMLSYVQYKYPFESWKRAIKAADLAKETCLSINMSGILAVQHQIIVTASSTADDDAAFCDCLLLPLVQDDNDNDDEEEEDNNEDDNNYEREDAYSMNDNNTMATNTQRSRFITSDVSLASRSQVWQSQPDGSQSSERHSERNSITTSSKSSTRNDSRVRSRSRSRNRNIGGDSTTRKSLASRTGSREDTSTIASQSQSQSQLQSQSQSHQRGAEAGGDHFFENHSYDSSNDNDNDDNTDNGRTNEEELVAPRQPLLFGSSKPVMDHLSPESATSMQRRQRRRTSSARRRRRSQDNQEEDAPSSSSSRPPRQEEKVVEEGGGGVAARRRTRSSSSSSLLRNESPAPTSAAARDIERSETSSPPPPPSPSSSSPLYCSSPEVVYGDEM